MASKRSNEEEEEVVEVAVVVVAAPVPLPPPPSFSSPLLPSSPTSFKLTGTSVAVLTSASKVSKSAPEATALFLAASLAAAVATDERAESAAATEASRSRKRLPWEKEGAREGGAGLLSSSRSIFEGERERGGRESGRKRRRRFFSLFFLRVFFSHTSLFFFLKPPAHPFFF